jgi:hypothetical protein
MRVTRFQDRLPVVDELGRKLYSALAESGVAFGTGIASVAARPPV